MVHSRRINRRKKIVKYLNAPIKINGTEIPNRLVMPPMATGKSTPDGTVTDKLLEYYDARSNGGYIGLIITEHSFIARNGMASKSQVSISSDEDIDGLSKIAETIHRNGTKVIAQISHAGLRSNADDTGFTPVGPGSRRCPSDSKRTDEFHTLTKDEIKELTAKFADAAVRAQKAGFDGVEIHCAHSYLLNQFWSPLTNDRDDEYGGCAENRIRFTLEVIEAVRAAVPENFIVAVRFGALDYMDGSSSPEEAVKAAVLMEKAGADMIDISGGMCGYMNGSKLEYGWFGDISEAVKKAVSVPVMVTGGVKAAEQAEKLLEEGKCDLAGVGRAIFRDADWARKAMAE